MKPRIFVGTMYSGEGDREECDRMIVSQIGVDVKHHIIENMPEKQAHNVLWKAWNESKTSFDLFVKVDADTVLTSEQTLLTIWETMSVNPRITGMQAPLMDFFTNGLINGLNCFTPKVTFNESSDELFCDRRVDVDHDIVIASTEVPETLRPAGFHCYRSTPKQAFHFGLHRALKNQTLVIDLLRKAYKANGDDIRAYALLGVECSKVFQDKVGFNYADERFQMAFNAVSNDLQRWKKALAT